MVRPSSRYHILVRGLILAASLGLSACGDSTGTSPGADAADPGGRGDGPTVPGGPAPAEDAAAASDPLPGDAPLRIDPPLVADVTGRYGGTLTWAEVGEVSVFNPIVTSSATESEIRDLLFDGLVDYDNGRWETVPSLAWKWDVSDDYLTWTFHLRRGVQWNDGEPFTSRDVVFTYESVVFHEKIPNSLKDGFRVGDAPFPTLTAPDEHTVVFHLASVNALLLTHVGDVKIVPEHRWRDSATGDDPAFNKAMGTGDDLSSVVGTGPFRVVEYSGAERIVFERNPLSWRQDRDGNRLPYVERAIVLLYKDLSSRSIAFLDGGFDLINDIPATDYQRFKEAERAGKCRVHRLGVSLNTNWISINQHPGKDPDGKPAVTPHKLRWFQDVRFRRALSHAIDRDGLVKLMLDGKGEAIYGPTSPGNKTWYSQATETPFDRAAAGALLDEMGLTDRDGDGVREDADGRRLTLELTTNVENNVRVKIISQIKSDWTALGIEAVTKPVNFNELVHELEDGHHWEVMLLGWASGVPPDPLNGKNIHLSSGRLHVWYPQQPEPANEWERKADAIIARMDELPIEAERKPLWAEYLAHHAAGLPMLYLYSQNAYAGSAERVQNLRASVLRPQTWYNVEELWVRD